MSLPRFPSLRPHQEGKAGYILLWLLEVSIPILVLIFLLRKHLSECPCRRIPTALSESSGISFHPG